MGAGLRTLRSVEAFEYAKNESQTSKRRYFQVA